MNEDAPRLRPITEADTGLLDRLERDPDVLGPFEWSGFARSRTLARQAREHPIGADRGMLAAAAADGTLVGIATYRDRKRSEIPFVSVEIGAALLPEHRGKGLGGALHRALVDYLFATTTANRIEAETDVENVAERTSLEHAGFLFEGTLRGAGFRAGAYRDVAVYGLLRADWKPEEREGDPKVG